MRQACTVHVITASLSDSGERVAHSIAGQFPDADIQVVAYSCESEDDDLEGIVAEAASTNGVVLSTLVQSKGIARVEELARQKNVPCVSLFPAFCDVMRRVVAQEPVQVSGLYRTSAEQVYQVSRAMHYAVIHDDGMRPEEWPLADAVLLGIAGTGKTTLAVFLATLGYKVATCTISSTKPPPAELSKVDIRRVFGVVLPPDTLHRHRTHRHRSIPSSPCEILSPGDKPAGGGYTDFEEVQRDVEYSEALFAELGVTVINRHSNSIETSVSDLVYQLSRRFETGPTCDQDGHCHDAPVRYHPMENAFNNSFRAINASTLRRTSSLGAKGVTIFVVTTGFGYAGEMAATVFGAQWPETRLRVEVMSHIRDGDMPAVVESIAHARGIMLHTLIPKVLRDDANRLAAERGVPCVDLFGGLIDCLSEKLQMRPTEALCSYVKSPDKYFKTCNAVEFALDHDDGADPEDWPQADAIILGVSRVGKSPLSVFLGTYGLKVANCPLFPEIDPPEELDKVDRRRVFGLIIDPEVLVQFRDERQKRLVQSGAVGDYADFGKVFDECEQVKAWLKKRRIASINVTGLPIPTIAGKIIQRLGERLSDFDLDSVAHLKKYSPLA
eukprot:EG_transcript_4100